MQVISLVAQKGGVGKTTLATNLARSFHQRGRSVLLIDCDQQLTATEWSMKTDGEEITVTQQLKPTLEKATRRLGEPFDRVIIDGAAQIQKMSVSAVKAADLVLVPIQPSAADVWSAEDVIDLIRARQEATGGRPRAALVVSRAITGTNIAKELSGFLEAFELPVLEGTHQRVAYVEALGRGLGVVDLSDEKARREIETLTDEIEALLS